MQPPPRVRGPGPQSPAHSARLHLRAALAHERMPGTAHAGRPYPAQPLRAVRITSHAPRVHTRGSPHHLHASPRPRCTHAPHFRIQQPDCPHCPCSGFTPPPDTLVPIHPGGSRGRSAGSAGTVPIWRETLHPSPRRHWLCEEPEMTLSLRWHQPEWGAFQSLGEGYGGAGEEACPDSGPQGCRFGLKCGEGGGGREPGLWVEGPKLAILGALFQGLQRDCVPPSSIPKSLGKLHHGMSAPFPHQGVTGLERSSNSASY